MGNQTLEKGLDNKTGDSQIALNNRDAQRGDKIMRDIAQDYVHHLHSQTQSAGRNMPSEKTMSALDCDHSIWKGFDQPIGLSKYSTDTPLKHHDKLLKPKEVKEVKDIALNPEALEAREKYLKVLEKRFANEPETLRRIKEEVLPGMEQSILHAKPETKGGRPPIDPQKELAQAYKNLSELGENGKAEALTYVDKSNQTRAVRSKYDVDNLLIGAMQNLSNPEFGAAKGKDIADTFDQGHKNTCASKSITRQEGRLLASEYTKRLLEASTKGEFEDGYGMLVKIDSRSMRPDLEAQHRYWGPQNHRSYTGQMDDLIVGSYSAAIYGLRTCGDASRYTYRQDATPSQQSATGEHFIDTWRNKEIAQHPMLDHKQIALVKQGLFGYRLADNFGEATTIGGPGYAVSGSQLLARLEENEANGWNYSTAITHTGYYYHTARGNGGAGAEGGGLHATSIVRNETGTGIHFINNWGSKCDFKDLKAETLAAWMGGAPSRSFLWDQQRLRQEILPLPDGQRQEVAVTSNDKSHQKGELSEKPKDKKEESKDNNVPIAEIVKQIYDANIKWGHCNNQLAALPENDPRRKTIMAQVEQALDDLMRFTSQLRTFA